MLRSILPVALIAMISALPVKAEPTLSVNWLIHEPVSLFDLGILRMKFKNETRWKPELMKRLKGKGLKLDDLDIYTSDVSYNYTDNEISTNAMLIGTPSEELCNEAVTQYRQIITHKSKFQMFPYDPIAVIFSHDGYTIGSEPEDLGKNLAQVFLFTIGIKESDETSGANSIFCTLDFNSDVPTFEKIDIDQISLIDHALDDKSIIYYCIIIILSSCCIGRLLLITKPLAQDCP